MFGEERSIPSLEVRIDEVADTRAIVIDQWGKERTIDIGTRRAKGAGPRVGEIWIIDRALGNWTLAACVQADWSWETWTPTITTYAGMVLNFEAGAHPANHARWTRVGNRVDVDYSQLLTLLAGSTASIVSISLPVPVQHPRTTFSGNVNAYPGLVWATTGDGTEAVWLQRADGVAFSLGLSHYSFTGAYEAAP